MVGTYPRVSALCRPSFIPPTSTSSRTTWPNHDRDIAPRLITCREAIPRWDVVGHSHSHSHSVKSSYTGYEQQDWRRHLLDALFGCPRGIAHHLGLSLSNSQRGKLYPASHSLGSGWAHIWLSTHSLCRALGPRPHIAIEPGRHLDCPTGSVFWTRADALQALNALRLGVVRTSLKNGARPRTQCSLSWSDCLSRQYAWAIKSRKDRSLWLEGSHIGTSGLEIDTAGSCATTCCGKRG